MAWSTYLGEQGVQAVHFLLLLDIGVVLSDTLQGQLLHKIDLIWIVHVLLDEGVHSAWKSGRVQEDLSVLWQIRDDRVEHVLEVLRQELVGLVHDKHAALVHDG